MNKCKKALAHMHRALSSIYPKIFKLACINSAPIGRAEHSAQAFIIAESSCIELHHDGSSLPLAFCRTDCWCCWPHFNLPVLQIHHPQPSRSAQHTWQHTWTSLRYPPLHKLVACVSAVGKRLKNVGHHNTLCSAASFIHNGEASYSVWLIYYEMTKSVCLTK